MARRGLETRIRACLFAIAFLLPAGLGAEGGWSALALLQEARGLASSGKSTDALELLRTLRNQFPGSPEVAESFALSVELSLACDDVMRARFFLTRLLAAYPNSALAYRAALSIADSLYDKDPRDGGSPAAALEYYAMAVERASRHAPGRDRALLRASELSLYRERDIAAARYYFRQVSPDGLFGPDMRSYTSLCVRLNWDVIGPEEIGLDDGNISSLEVDGDDLWIGTWNGGVARYSLASGEYAPFLSPASSRSIRASARRVWVGTSEGLAFYSKVSARWGVEDALPPPQKLPVQALLALGEELYAGTLGAGLQRMKDGQWQPVEDGELPGRFITVLATEAGQGKVLIGTMTLGLLELDPETGRITSLRDSHPELTARNITSLLPDSAGRIWIGTYGEGLFQWTGGVDPIRRFTAAGGTISDDWVLSMGETPRGVYFGTLGGGVTVLEESGNWKKLGIAEGLPSLDITAVEWRRPYVYFGTLGAGVSRYYEGEDGPQF